MAWIMITFLIVMGEAVPVGKQFFPTEGDCIAAMWEKSRQFEEAQGEEANYILTCEPNDAFRPHN